jgi:hypothetical protein
MRLIDGNRLVVIKDAPTKCKSSCDVYREDQWIVCHLAVFLQAHDDCDTSYNRYAQISHGYLSL